MTLNLFYSSFSPFLYYVFLCCKLFCKRHFFFWSRVLGQIVGYGPVGFCLASNVRLSDGRVCTHHIVWDVFVSPRESFMRKRESHSDYVMYRYSPEFRFPLFCQLIFILPICLNAHFSLSLMHQLIWAFTVCICQQTCFCMVWPIWWLVCAFHLFVFFCGKKDNWNKPATMWIGQYIHKLMYKRGMFEMNCLFLSGDFKFQVSPKVLISCPRSTPHG